jgi:hypothetical protein
MISETVIIEVAESSSYPDGHAVVTAEFLMRNLGDTVEEMNVRFPLHHAEYDIQSDECYFSLYPSINNIAVWIDGRQVEVLKTFGKVNPLPVDGTPLPDIIPCWAHFPVTFPPGQDTSIVVKYTVSGYRTSSTDPSTAYYYVLQTGAGWKDTIGKAQIIVRLPYEVTPMNFEGCDPDCTQTGNEIRWYYEDFEPTKDLIRVYITLPPLWRKILTETENTTANPNDGEAWGRLGKAYKEAIIYNKGFRNGAAAVEMYQLSQDAYQRAVTLLPNDADWHYGFTELLCWKAEWSIYDEEYIDPTIADWIACIEQLKQTLDINPGHVKANELLRSYEGYRGGDLNIKLVDLSGPQPDYLILTPQPTTTKKVVATRVPGETPEVAWEKTRIPSSTPRGTPQPKQSETIAATATEVASLAAEVQTPTITTDEISTSHSQNLKTPLYVGIIVMLVVVAAGIVILKKR